MATLIEHLTYDRPELKPHYRPLPWLFPETEPQMIARRISQVLFNS